MHDKRQHVLKRGVCVCYVIDVPFPLNAYYKYHQTGFKSYPILVHICWVRVCDISGNSYLRSLIRANFVDFGYR